MPTSLILALETSCDETAGALLRDGREVLAEFVASQVDLHRAYGGVVPEVACRAHMECLLPGLDRLFRDGGVGPRDLDAVAVTSRPGLIGALLVGVSAAKALALAWGKPLIGVDHVEAHIAAAGLACPELAPPYVALVASGGHSNLYLVRDDGPGPEAMRRLASTLDDAAGEAFDKAAKLLGLGFPGGPRIEAAARTGNPRAFPWLEAGLPPDGENFSFSGLKTAVMYAARGRAGRKGPLLLDGRGVADAAASFQEAATHALTTRALAAAERHRVGWLALGGGVAANARLREKLAAGAKTGGLRLAMPPLRLCTDNAVMVAARAARLFAAGARDGLDLEAEARQAD
ncbi:MAG: tRNA (adenosine(37)-N6)-threonylcarbamoyltransferase complex transferase subunit TsaD [Planctomycetota bacterium]|jgi:N6-L-threonylcarbamoyladenine synthase|nr:tRNA (adenosine(37)-N6)-threonylcarbamoyltransferase complex transferase subunit TsaD [Planctomycetota bacterium]